MSITVNPYDINDTCRVYQSLMLGLIMRYPEFKALDTYLKEHHFKDQPASTKYHLNISGGLLLHSVNVALVLDKLTSELNLQWQRAESPIIVGLFHDLCKLDAYQQDLDGFTYNEDQLIKGHGDKSVMMLSQFTTLTEEEVLCIRYHMGAYETDSWKQFDSAIKRYPNVLFTHTADMIASKLWED